MHLLLLKYINIIIFFFCPKYTVGYTTDDLRFIWQSGDPVQLETIALPQFDIKKEDIEYGNCTKYYKGTGIYFNQFICPIIKSVMIYSFILPSWKEDVIKWMNWFCLMLLLQESLIQEIWFIISVLNLKNAR